MTSDWITAMDAVASAGIISYDAPAAILGQNPRYVGHPDFNKAMNMSGPNQDVFDPNNKDIVKPKTWKKKALGVLATVLAAAGIIKLIQCGKLNITTIKNFGKKAINLIKKPFVWAKNLFSKFMTPKATTGTTPPATPTP
ncbi:hypothetical protein IJO12_03965 [bacterium]|nr:hypothetical protein [bacterium]